LGVTNLVSTANPNNPTLPRYGSDRREIANSN
jgi:hypothetical protein